MKKCKENCVRTHQVCSFGWWLGPNACKDGDTHKDNYINAIKFIQEVFENEKSKG